MTPSRDTTGEPEARVIKYRIWDPEENQMMESGGTPTMLSRFFLRSAKMHTYYGMPYQQFTGLFDRAGKEIYEGDILKYSGLPPFEVVHKDVALGFFVDKGHKEFKAFATHGYLREILAETDVIGNTHQNPELLKSLSNQPDYTSETEDLSTWPETRGPEWRKMEGHERMHQGDVGYSKTAHEYQYADGWLSMKVLELGEYDMEIENAWTRRPAIPKDTP